MLDRLKKPIEPDVDDCCGDGCDPCVWDTYDLKLENYTSRFEKYNE
jgi:hypothetical protein